MKTTIYTAAIALLGLASCQSKPNYTQVYTTENQNWVTETVEAAKGATTIAAEVNLTNTAQTILGFGGCFNELGWVSLSELSEADRDGIIKELFAPDFGANLTICRMPVAANDFARDWYSYNETDGDLAQKNFSIDNDRETLIPFIHEAQKQNPDIKIWASPWSPPSWMKHNKHYASRSFIMDGPDIYGNDFSNGLAKENEGREGTDMFITTPEYLESYALYFSKFIDAYRAEDINIYGVMPQNEFNSDQVFPSCCWTPGGLATFIGDYLGPKMEEQGVEVMLGTMERPNYLLLDTIMQHKEAAKYITAAGFQWAGKDALVDFGKAYPELTLIQTEQECGDGKNDRAGFLHSWGLMKHYLRGGVSIYDYWNISLKEGGYSRWGWQQNSLVVVDPATKEYRYTPEFYLLKHFSNFVKKGAKLVEVTGQSEDILAFENLDGSVVVVAFEPTGADTTLELTIKGEVYSLALKAGSLNTFVL